MKKNEFAFSHFLVKRAAFLRRQLRHQRTEKFSKAKAIRIARKRVFYVSSLLGIFTAKGIYQGKYFVAKCFSNFAIFKYI
jgi:hypothetical protein